MEDSWMTVLIGWICCLNLRSDGIITVESRLFIGSYASRTDESSPTEAPPTRMRPLLANWKAISGMPMEQETFLSALASDFNMFLPYLEYMVQVPHQGGKGNINDIKTAWNNQMLCLRFEGIWRSHRCTGLKKPSWQNPWGKSMFSHHCLSATKLGFWLLLLLFAAWILLQLQRDSNKRWATHYSKNERNCSFVLCWR